jgi:hypothetical protein
VKQDRVCVVECKIEEYTPVPTSRLGTSREKVACMRAIFLLLFVCAAAAAAPPPPKVEHDFWSGFQFSFPVNTTACPQTKCMNGTHIVSNETCAIVLDVADCVMVGCKNNLTTCSPWSCSVFPDETSCPATACPLVTTVCTTRALIRCYDDTGKLDTGCNIECPQQVTSWACLPDNEAVGCVTNATCACTNSTDNLNCTRYWPLETAGASTIATSSIGVWWMAALFVFVSTQ